LLFLFRLLLIALTLIEDGKFISVNDVAVTPARPIHVSKVGQSKKGKTKQATLVSDFHAHGSSSFLWPIRLARS